MNKLGAGKEMHKMWRTPVVLLFTLMLAGCGGGGKPAASTISGVAAAGSPMVGAVYLKDSSTPSHQVSAPIAHDGSFSLDVSGLTSPYLLSAVGTVNGHPRALYSISGSPGTVNINTLSTLAVALSTERDDLGSLYASPEPAAMTVAVRALPAAISNIQTVLKPTLNKFGSGNINFISDLYLANHQNLDLFMDMVGVSVYNGSVTIRKLDHSISSPGVTIPLADFQNHSLDITTDPIPSPGEVLIEARGNLVGHNGTIAFTAGIVGSTDHHVDWSVVEPDGGTITDSGIYTAPAVNGTYHVRATNPSDGTKSATATVTVSDQNLITVESLQPGVLRVSASNLTGVAGIDFTLVYDPRYLSNLQVTQGQMTLGGLFQANANYLPCAARWVYLSAAGTLQGSGELALIIYDPLTVNAAETVSVTAKLVNAKGIEIGTISTTVKAGL